MVLDEVFEEVSGEEEGQHRTHVRSNEDYGDRKEETIELGLEDLRISIPEHYDGVGNG